MAVSLYAFRSFTSRLQSYRRKRAFVAYAHPVVLHILEHLNAGHLPERLTSSAENMRWKSSCRIDGLRFKNVSAAIKHVLDAHNDIVEISALDLVLEEMGLFEIFRDSMSVVLGQQSWQLEEALGFGAYKLKTCAKPAFLNEEGNGVTHRADCTRHWDPSTPMCSCESITEQDKVVAPIEKITQYRSYRLRTTSLHMPEESAACYEEFLQDAESHGGEELHSSVAIVTNTNAALMDADEIVASLPAPNEDNLTETVTMPLTSVKVELTEERSDLDLHLTTTEAILPSASLLNSSRQNDEKPKYRKKRPSKKLKKSICKEIKREVDGVVLPQKNNALPFKNVIQGPKTVAAALVAALGSPTKATDSLTLPLRNPVAQAQDGEAADYEFPNAREEVSNPPSNFGSAMNKTSTRGENDSESSPGIPEKKFRLASEDNQIEATKNSSCDTQSKRRLRAPSGRRKSGTSEEAFSET